MNINTALAKRSENCCELCAATEDLAAFAVAPKTGDNAEDCIFACGVCREQLADFAHLDANHWHCLNGSMWNTEPAVQVVVWRLLHQLRNEGGFQDMLDSLYLDEETLRWAEALETEKSAAVQHLDSNGAILEAGDTVVLIKDLDVKGATFTAKRGTAVRRISLVQDNAEQIEGKINGQQIVILTKFVKKSK
jgi:protein PhnA